MQDAHVKKSLIEIGNNAVLVRHIVLEPLTKAEEPELGQHNLEVNLNR